MDDNPSKEKFSNYIVITEVNSLHNNIESLLKILKKLKSAVLPFQTPLDLNNPKVKKEIAARTAARDPRDKTSLPHDLSYTQLSSADSQVKKLMGIFEQLKLSCKSMTIDRSLKSVQILYRA